MNSRMKNKTENKGIRLMQGRAHSISIFFMIICLLLICRIFYIQVIMSKEYGKKAVQQRMVSIPISSNRGEVYDRNMIPFTDRELKTAVIVFAGYVQNKKNTVDIVSKACDISPEIIEKKISNTVEPVEFTVQNNNNTYLNIIQNGGLDGVMAIEKKMRYTDKSIARHAVGYIGKSDKKGYMGIEKSMNSFLAGEGSDSIAAVVDSGMNIIPGLGFRKVEANQNGQGYGIKLTLDYHIQSIIEETLKSHKVNGAVVVMDTSNGKILGMASTPDFDQNDLNKYLNKDSGELINNALWSFDLGSIFKTVVAAAGFENNLIDENEKYICNRSIEVGNTTINCSTYKTHENIPIDIKQAFSLSCNTAFVKIGMKVGADKILDMASKFGFGQKNCFAFSEEKSGYLPTKQEEGIGNISIGQGKIQATPLQVTSMMATIANNGLCYEPQIIEELVTEDGITVKKMDTSKPQIIISPTTAYKLKDLLLGVTRTGTGKTANMDAYGGCSGKTSSAQTGIKSGTVVHAWFAGFAPSNHPRYAMTVFIYNGQSGGGTAAPIFKEIATKILDSKL